MTFQDIVNQVVSDRGPILAIFFSAITLIQISPIKLNPWSAIFAWLGKQLNKEVIDKMDELEERLEDHIKDSSEAELKARRTSILDFSSSVIRGVNYHKEKFDFMINECDSYEAYCKDNDIKNGVAEASIAEIRRVYQERLRNDDFLRERIFAKQSNKLAARKEE